MQQPGFNSQQTAPLVASSSELATAIAETWTELRSGLLARLRAAYMRDVEQLAHDLFPRFQSGEVGDFNGVDDSNDAARERLEAACAERFGLTVRRLANFEYEGGDDEHAGLILYVSPSTGEEEVDRGALYDSLSIAAAAAVMLDVLDIARKCGWNTGAGRAA